MRGTMRGGEGGIGYFGYSYYSQFASRLTVARVASDRENGVLDTKDAKVDWLGEDPG